MTATSVRASQSPGTYDVGVRCFPGLRRFAREAGVQYEQLQRWRIRGPYWVPSPVVTVGRWPGWPLPMIQTWAPIIVSGAGPVPAHWCWPEPTVEALDSATMCRRYGISNAGLRLRISRGDIPRPDIWVDDKPGWIGGEVKRE